MKQRRLTGKGEFNYRNIGLGFAIGVLIEMGKELDPKCRQALDIGMAEKALSKVLNNLPDGMTEEQVKLSGLVFFDMEKSILKHDQAEYRGFMTGLEREELFEMIEPERQDGTDYL